jgi:quercetin 2,3-dioxygenase
MKTGVRPVAGVYSGNGFHWVGDGFHVTQVFPSAHDLGERISPFLLMDYHAPYRYAPTDTPRGVGVHPHRGFETVTLAFEGVLAHHDSTGAGGVISAGDVQWMTAASGILHKEYHEAEWARAGGRMHMMQLWVNLPAAHKMDPPGYQPLAAADMATVSLDGGIVTVTVIAGSYRGVSGPARTFSPINLWRVRLDGGASMDMSFPATDNAAVFVLEGDIDANDTIADEHQLVLFENEGTDIRLTTTTGAHLLVLSGTPLGEPVVANGPFVMNTRSQIMDAYNDFSNGRFGHLD